MKKDGKYETKRFESWQKCKEASGQHWLDVWGAKDKGKTLVLRSGEFGLSMTAGLPDSEDLQEAPYGQIILTTMPELAPKLFDDLETMGYKDICTAMGITMAALFTGRGPHGPLPRPDFVLSVQFCDVEGKMGQIFADHYGIPSFFIDIPKPVRGTKRERHHKYLVAQMHDAIEWMEEVTGKNWDDEAFIEGVSNEWQTCALWARIVELNKAIPAPMDLKSMGVFYVPAFTAGQKKWVVDLYKSIYDEVSDRVDKGIAAVANERCRLLHEGLIPSYFGRQMFKIAEEYGVAFIGSELMFGLAGAFNASLDGSWVPAKTPQERGIELKTRDDAVEALADLYLYNLPWGEDVVLHRSRLEDLLKRVDYWHADGVVIHLDRGCHALPLGMPDGKIALDKQGIPNVVYEADNADPRQFSEAQVLERLQSFFEALGLARSKQ